MKKLPNIKVLFNDAWESLRPSLMQLFKLYVICAVIGIVTFAVFGSIGFFGGVGGLLGFMGTKPSLETVLRNSNIPVIAFSGIGFFISMWVLTLASTISMIDIIAKKGVLSPMEALRGSKNRIIPLFITSLLSSVLVLGSAVLLFVPGVFMAVLLAFAQIDVVLGNKSPLHAIRRSARLVMDNFGQLFLHWGALVLLYIAVQVIIPNVLNNAADELRGLVGMLSSITNVLLSWFFISYSILLYKKLSVKETKKDSMVWMWVMAGAGWIIFFFLMSSIIRFVTSPVFMNAITEGMMKNQNMRNEQFMRQYEKQYQKQYQLNMDQYNTSKDTSKESY